MSIVVVSPDQMPDWLEKRARIFHEIERQLIRGLEKYGAGLLLYHLQELIEHRDPFAIKVPPNGKIHLVSVPVDESRLWKEVMHAAGPNTLDSHAIWKVGDQYPAKTMVSVSQQIIFVNFGFGKYVSSEHALAWGEEQHLVPATPRQCFAVGEHCAKLNNDLGLDFMAIVSLVPCFFGGRQHVCSVWWYRSERRVGLGWFDDDWDDYYWFAFVRE